MNQFHHGHALVIGVGGPELNHTTADAEGLATLLQDPERCAYPSEAVQLLTGANATRENILLALQRLAETTDEQSTVVISFAGHGYKVKGPTGEFFYLLTSDVDPKRLYKTAISGDMFAQALQQIRAKHVLLLLDCCHAGELDPIPGITMAKAPLPPEVASLFSSERGRALVASSQATEYSFAGRPYSVFTLALIDALSGVNASDHDGYVRAADLALHAREMVPRHTRDQQHPIVHFSRSENFEIAFYAAGDPQPRDLPYDPDAITIEPYAGAWSQTQPAGRMARSAPQSLPSVQQGPVVASTFQGPANDDSANRNNGVDGTVYIAGMVYQSHNEVIASQAPQAGVNDDRGPRS